MLTWTWCFPISACTNAYFCATARSWLVQTLELVSVDIQHVGETSVREEVLDLATLDAEGSPLTAYAREH